MLFNKILISNFYYQIWSPSCMTCRSLAISKYMYHNKIENNYSEFQKSKILKVVNESDMDSLSNYDITKSRLRSFINWKKANGSLKNISDIEMVDGFTDKTLKKLCDSIVNDDVVKRDVKKQSSIKGQYLHPRLSENVRNNCSRVLAVYVTASSISWTLVNRSNYEVLLWEYHSIGYPDGKKLQLTDIMDTAWVVTRKLPSADLYAMKAETTALRGGGSDPNNPKVMMVNLQKAQLVAMVVALLNARPCTDRLDFEDDTKDSDKLQQKVYFLRPTLPFRLFDTLVGNERVSTDQTVETLLNECSNVSQKNEHVYIPQNIQSIFRSKNELQRDMLGQCLFLALTFMDVCIYKNELSISKLAKTNV